MAAKKTTKRAGAAPKKSAAAGPSAGRALAGKTSRGREWDPSQEEPQAAAALVTEVREPRPYTSRYPIPDEQFEALKAAASKAKLAKAIAEAVKDSGKKKDELSALMPAAALAPGLPPAAAPTGSTNFAGIAATGWLPPDCTMAVGPDHVVLSVNSSVAIYAKAGGAALLQRTLTQWFSNVSMGLTVFDPKALYDQHAGRWVVMAVGVSKSPKKSVYLMSFSNSSNPMGPWRNYSFNAMVDGTTATDNWADFPAIGVDSVAFYVTSNQFQFGGGFQYAKIRVIPKLGPYAGGLAPFFDFVKMKNADNTTAFTIQPCHTFGAPQVEYLVNSKFPSGNVLTVWSITNAAILPVLTRKQVTISSYSLPPNADQKGGAPPLNTGDVRVLHAVFRGDSLWCAFSTAFNWGGTSNRASILWCQIRAAVPAVVQQGLYGTSTAHYYFPACCPDNNGNMTMVFNFSSTTRFAGILYTGRRSTDLAGRLQPSALLKEGVAHYVRLDDLGRNRWGDYNGVAADPSNARLIWFYSGYASAVNTWGTWTGSGFF
jgi:hypothetical protein